MARIRPTSPFEDIRGRLGGLVFSSNASGAFVRSLSIPRQTFSPLQGASKTDVTRIGKLWPQLDDAARLAWDVFASLPENVRYDYWGNPFFLSGFNWFQIINRSALYLGEPMPAPVPTFPAPTVPPAMRIRIDPMGTSGGSLIESLGPWEYPGSWAWVGLRLWPNVGRKSPPQPIYRLLIWINYDLYSVDWDALILDRFGEQQPKGRWFVRIYAIGPDLRPGPWKDFSAQFGKTVEEDL